MSKVISIDPGKFKCGLILAETKDKTVYEAIVIKSNLMSEYIKKIYKKDKNLKLLVGNGTSSRLHIKRLRDFVPNLIIVDEKNTTYRAKQRYFDIFPLKGIKRFFPREIFILNKNLDAIAALIILEDFHKCKFEISDKVVTKTWQRQ